jgi:hypothetical protein
VPVDIYARGVRRLDLATFTGDAWATAAALALPPDDGTVPRMLGVGSPIRWAIYGMDSGEDDAAQVVDTTTSLSTCLVQISRTRRREPLVAALASTSGTVVGRGFTEPDMSDGDLFVVAIPTITIGTAPWLWVVPLSGFSRAAHGPAI